MLGEHGRHQERVVSERNYKLVVGLAIVLVIVLASMLTALGLKLQDDAAENLALEKRLATCEQEKANLATELKYCRNINTPSGDAVLGPDGQPDKWEIRDSN